MALAKMTFDELNQLVGYKVSEPYEEYYAPMRISAKQKQKRIEMAKRLDDVFIGLLCEYFYANQLDSVVASDIYERTREEYLSAIEQAIEPDSYLENHAIELIASTILILRKHADDPYFYSADRARAIAENDANSVWNYEEFQEAYDKGYRFKTWNTIMDGRERESHAEVNGTTIPLNDVFHLQGGDCYFCRDDSLGMSDEEICGCRCSLSYS